MIFFGSTNTNCGARSSGWEAMTSGHEKSYQIPLDQKKLFRQAFKTLNIEYPLLSLNSTLNLNIDVFGSMLKRYVNDILQILTNRGPDSGFVFEANIKLV